MVVSEINFALNLSYGDTAYLQDNWGNNTALQNAFYMQYVVNGIVLPILAVFGVLGNILTMIVLWRREMHSTTILFLRALVLTDTGIIVVVAATVTPFTLSFFHAELGYFKDVVYPNVFTPVTYIVMVIQQCNVWITVSVSVERYISICHPFKAAKICTKRRTWIILFAICVISVIYNIPRCFASRTKSPCSPNDTSLCYMLVDTTFGKTTFYTKVYMVWMYAVLIYIIPLTLLAVLNCLIIMELMRMRARRIGTNIQDDNEANLSLVLVLIVIVFICCQTPGLFSQFDFLFDPIVFLQWIAFGNTLFVTNSSVNFLIYTAVGRRFRKVLLKVFKTIFGKSIFSRSKNSGSSSDHELLETLRSQLYRDSEVTQINDIHRLEKMKLTS
ncbi:FMRFamide receptor-like [Crassostrea virginica]|uniref:FMRFamide receptor-like n=1 Tax=Crassostrea virginica TaxID=6565 RepID=A0A8B8CG37_CRAVI|nr:FMRFamide receptor-like [Crassostrea virginica]XP_022314671.1 FMRFamide receptor-like [Crassostrea virginica]XP_022314672.1 FMRFamide receptor-like [Crassostrea virginica]XP_022314673.1 FMRFamide receptor-like [Crassostrea virginica]